MARGRPRKNPIEVPQKSEQPQIVDNSLVKENNDIISQKRQEKLNNVLREINKKDGAIINFADTIAARSRLSFGYKSLDKLTGGGLVCGVYTTVWGSKGSGKTTIAYKAIATTQKIGKIAVYIDMERSYDAEWAKKFGVNTEKLIYIICHTAEEALDVIIKLCKEKVIDLIVLDSLQGLSPHGEQYEGKADKERSVEDDSMALLARKLSQFFRMATPHVSDAKCAVLLIGQARMDLGSFIKCEILSGGHALAHNSRLILRMRRGQKADAPHDKIKTNEIDEKGKPVFEKQQVGFDCVIHVEKSQIENCLEQTEIHVPFHFTEGIKDE